MSNQTNQDGVNSQEYWDSRFKLDWRENSGVEQSRFFMNVALDSLPDWFKSYLNQKEKTICDWGCAQGDGTALLADNSSANITGIDFSDSAIECARKRYSKNNLQFLSRDLLTGNYEQKYDAIISSNVFEHFANPWQLFTDISIYAKEFFLIMVPYQEDPDNLHSEHFHSFDKREFKSTVGDWKLVYWKVINTADIEGTY